MLVITNYGVLIMGYFNKPLVAFYVWFSLKLTRNMSYQKVSKIANRFRFRKSGNHRVKSTYVNK